MTWQARSVEEQRQEFVRLAHSDTIPIRALCRRFGISPKTGYKWLKRAEQGGDDWMADRSRRPQKTPRHTEAAMEARIVALRQQHPSWGGRKLRSRLERDGERAVPSPSTSTAILARYDLIDPAASEQRQLPLRFEYPEPNALWQLDFMGHLPLASGRVHPLSLLDDHSRYCLGLWACANERRTTVQPWLQEAFERDGLPLALLTDNGSPWGASGNRGVTALEVELIQLGITVVHGRPYSSPDPGQGRTLPSHPGHRADQYPRLCHAGRRGRSPPTLANALQPRTSPSGPRRAGAGRSQLPQSPSLSQPTAGQLVYGPEDTVRLVRGQRLLLLSQPGLVTSAAVSLAGRQVGIRPTATDGVFAVYFCHHQVATIDLRDPS